MVVEMQCNEGRTISRKGLCEGQMEDVDEGRLTIVCKRPLYAAKML